MTVSELIDELLDLPVTSQNLSVVIRIKDESEDEEEDCDVIGLSDCSLIGTPAIRIDYRDE
jgi:hypothetical protein